MTAKTLLTTTCLLVTLALPNAAVAQNESTPKDFEAFVEAFQGRWVGQVKWVTDNAMGKRGETVTAYFEGAVINNGKTYQGHFFGGEGRGTWTVFYNAREKQIQDIWLTSTGRYSKGVLWRDGENWMSQGAGCGGEGEAMTDQSKILVSDGGEKHTWKGSLTVDGKPGDPVNDVWRRIE